MPVVISLLRGINLAGHRQIKMEALRSLYESLDLRDPTTYVNSGNVVFTTRARDLTALAKRIEDGIERTFGFQSDVILRTPDDLREVIARNPFADRNGIEPNKLLVTFLAADPGDEARNQVRAIKTDPEEMRIIGRELYIYFPNGMGRSKLPLTSIGKILKTPGTARNWNTVCKLLALAEKLDV